MTPEDNGDVGEVRLATFTLADGSAVGVARLRDAFAVRVEPGVAEGVVFADRRELRQLGLELIYATQVDRPPLENLSRGLGDER
jgi:hypothetical protein